MTSHFSQADRTGANTLKFHHYTDTNVSSKNGVSAMRETGTGTTGVVRSGSHGSSSARRAARIRVLHSRPATVLLLVLSTLAGVTLALSASPALAAVTHKFEPVLSGALSKDVPALGPHGEAVPKPGSLLLVGSSMTIDSGRLWIAEEAVSSGQVIDRVDEYDDSTGAFVSQIAASSAATYGEDGIAVGHAGGKVEMYLGERLNDTGEAVVAVFDEAGVEGQLWTGAATPAGSFGGGIGDVAVDNSTGVLDERKGDVYVSVPSQGVIDVFHPEADGKEHYVGQILGTAPGTPFASPRKLAVSDANGDVIVLDEGRLDVLEPAALGEYVLVHQVTETPSGALRANFNLAVNGASGEIYLTEGFHPTIVNQFSSAGVFLGRITGAGTPAGDIADVYSLAVDAASGDVYIGDTGPGAAGGAPPTFDVFGPDITIPDVAVTEPVSGLTPYSATLNGMVNPDEAGEATCEFEYGTSTSYGRRATCTQRVPQGNAAVAVRSASVSGLSPDTTYHYRLDATNIANGSTNIGEGTDDLGTFTTPGPGLHGESVSEVTAESVTFQATIDPHGTPTSSYFQYGASNAYGKSIPAAPGLSLGSGEGDVEAPLQHVQGLAAGTVYHYRVVAVQGGEVFPGPDQTFTTQTQSGELVLPDGRNWELVSPPDKRGGTLASLSESGDSVTQAALDGSAITYPANAPTEPQPQGFANDVQVLSSRTASGWTSRDIASPHEHAAGTGIGEGLEYRYFADDLSAGILQPFGLFEPGISDEASEQTPYLRTLGSCESSCYRPLVTGKQGFADVSPSTHFGEEEECKESSGSGEKGTKPQCGPFFLDATTDLSHVVLSSVAALLPGAGTEQLYEWSAGALQQVSLLPPNAKGEELPAQGLRIGFNEGPQLGAEFQNAHSSARRALSVDGSRVFWEAHGPNALYVRDTVKHQTLQIDAAEPACLQEPASECENGGGRFQIASSNGSRVIFTDERRLTKDSGASTNKQQDLYECKIVERSGGKLGCELTDLTPLTGHESADVQGNVLGASEDASTVYFVADSTLGGTPGATPGTCQNEATGVQVDATCNLYERTATGSTFVASLSGRDAFDWNSAVDGQTARVSPNGNWLAFSSTQPLTGYDNHDVSSGQPDTEVFVYGTEAAKLACASCDPTGARPSGSSIKGEWSAATLPPAIPFAGSMSDYQGRSLSDQGRLFFNSYDSLVPQDVNAKEDVYEREPEGLGSCTAAASTFDRQSGGCVGLISSGSSPNDSSFMDASESGDDVFFITAAKLTTDDVDNAEDIYDAHECTSSSPCFPAAATIPPPCITEASCKIPPMPQPAIFGAPASATFSGPGNVVQSVVAVKPKSAAQLGMEKLAKALKRCRRDKSENKRVSCERAAHKRYGAKPKSTKRAKGRK